MSTAMTRAEQEAFLAEIHVGILSIPEDGRGPLIAVEPSEVERDVRPLAHRYLGPAMGDRFMALTSGADTRQENIRVRTRPERWFTVDFAKQLTL